MFSFMVLLVEFSLVSMFTMNKHNGQPPSSAHLTQQMNTSKTAPHTHWNKRKFDQQYPETEHMQAFITVPT
jgi:hypothetical protein